MDVLEPYSVLPFPTDYYLLYKGIAFDGCFFYLTMPGKSSVYKYDTNFWQECIITVNKPYSCICYDNTENCFWASVDSINSFIFKLDCNLKEIDYIRLNGFKRFCPIITGLSYNCGNNSLLVGFKNFVAEVQKDGGMKCLPPPHKSCCKAVLSISPYYVVSIISDKSQCILIYTCEGCLIKSYQFPELYQIVDILFYPCDYTVPPNEDANIKKDKKTLTFYILATKHCCYPCLLKCNLDGCNMELCCCNYECCHYGCCRLKSKEQCTNDLIESIALEETALSHILNELGEKLQKSIQMADDVCDLLEVNNAVNKTIMNITQLEHILYAKLETISSINSNNGCDKVRHKV